MADLDDSRTWQGLAAKRDSREQTDDATEKPNDSASNWYIYMERSLADSGCVCSRMTIEAAARAAERLLKVELERQIHAGRDYHEELIEENSIPSYAEFDAIGPWMKRIRVRLSKETASVVEYYLPDIAKAALAVHLEMLAESARVRAEHPVLFDEPRGKPIPAAEPEDAEELLSALGIELLRRRELADGISNAVALGSVADAITAVLTNRRHRNGN